MFTLFLQIFYCVLILFWISGRHISLFSYALSGYCLTCSVACYFNTQDVEFLYLFYFDNPDIFLKFGHFIVDNHAVCLFTFNSWLFPFFNMHKELKRSVLVYKSFHWTNVKKVRENQFVYFMHTGHMISVIVCLLPRKQLNKTSE